MSTRLRYDQNGYTRVHLTVDQAELIGDALEALAADAPQRRGDVAALAASTGLLVSDSDGGNPA